MSSSANLLKTDPSHSPSCFRNLFEIQGSIWIRRNPKWKQQNHILKSHNKFKVSLFHLNSKIPYMNCQIPIIFMWIGIMGILHVYIKKHACTI